MLRASRLGTAAAAAVLALSARPASAADSRLAPLDPLAGRITIGQAPPAPHDVREHIDAPIPKILHFIHHPGGAAEVGEHWLRYAQAAALDVYRWRVDDQGAWRSLSMPQLHDTVRALAGLGLGELLVDVMRYAVLLRHGGIAVADHVAPPARVGGLASLAEVVPLRGLVVTSAAYAREVGSGSALVVDDALLMAPPGHPVLVQAVWSLTANIEGWPGRLGVQHREYLTGSVYLSRLLAGVFRVVPRTTWVHLGMLQAAAGPDMPHLHPRFDPTMQEVPTRAAGMLARGVGGFNASAGDALVPRRVHQIWFGDRGAMPTILADQWRQSAESQGWAYRRWGDRDRDELLALMPAANGQLLRERLAAGRYRGAADIARLAILERLGGLYVDCDLGPPQAMLDAELGLLARLPLDQVVPRCGLTLAAQHHGRTIGTSGLFVGNRMMAAPPYHPVIALAVAQLADHARLMDRRRAADAYATGSFLLNRCLEGGVTLWPTATVHQWWMD